MTYQEAREFIDLSNQYGSVLGLSTITELLNRLGNPQDQIKMIHVAGTNGKGSTTAFLSSILASQGYLVGRYISPAVFDYRERIQITRQEECSANPFPEEKLTSKISEALQEEKLTANILKKLTTDYISEQNVAAAIDQIKPICEAMVREGLPHPTSFEIETAMAFLFLLQKRVDYAVIEVGLGGRLDATNVMKKPICSVITSISMDHMQFLGDTMEQIATEKAGIIKLGVPVVTNNRAEKVLQVLNHTCHDKQTKLIIADATAIMNTKYSAEGTEFIYQGHQYRIALIGKHQIENALLAIETAKLLNKNGHPISDQAILEGIREARWKGRFEILRKEPYVIIDGAHNQDAAYKLVETLQLYFLSKKMIFIMGVFADKDYKKILQITAPLAHAIITITPKNSRGLDSTLLAKEAQNYTKNKVIDAKNIQQAITYAYQISTKEDVILAFGSLSYLGEFEELLCSF